MDFLIFSIFFIASYTLSLALLCFLLVIIQFASIDSEKDPDDLIRQDPSEWKKVISDAIPLYKHLINNLDLVFDLTDEMQINDAANVVYKLVFQNTDSHSQDQTLGLLATKLKIEREKLPSPKILNSKLSPRPITNSINNNQNPIEKHIIALIDLLVSEILSI